MSSASQLFLLADHIKLSLLERQRARSLNLSSGTTTTADGSHGDDGDAQDGHVSRSLDQFRSGLTTLQQERDRLEQSGDVSAAAAISESLPSLTAQLNDLTAQFHGFSSPSAAGANSSSSLTQPNDPALADDFAHAASTAPKPSHTVGGGNGARTPKTVRFSDTPPSPTAELFGDRNTGRYRDDPSPGYRDHAAQLSNEQIHTYHSHILEEQDEQLDRLGESIGRQRELSMQIGDELDSHVAMLDDVDDVVDRHQTRLDRAKKTLGKVARGAGENKQMTAIVVLIIILVLLIAILK